MIGQQPADDNHMAQCSEYILHVLCPASRGHRGSNAIHFVSSLELSMLCICVCLCWTISFGASLVSHARMHNTRCAFTKISIYILGLLLSISPANDKKLDARTPKIPFLGKRNDVCRQNCVTTMYTICRIAEVKWTASALSNEKKLVPKKRERERDTIIQYVYPQSICSKAKYAINYSWAKLLDFLLHSSTTYCSPNQITSERWRDANGGWERERESASQTQSSSDNLFTFSKL